MPEAQLPTLLLIWLGAVATLIIARWSRKTVGTGLVFAYVLNLWMIHWVAPAFYLQPWYRYYDLGIVVAGLRQSVYAIVAFAVGSIVLTPVLRDFGLLPRTVPKAEPDAYLPKAYLWLGIGSYALLSLGPSYIPSATALVSTGQQLIVIGLCLGCWYAWRTTNFKVFAGWMAFALSMPFITIITQGFISYGAVAALTVLIFVSGFIRPRWKVIAAALLLGYVGLSVFVTYRRDRGAIREAVWGGQSLGDRWTQVTSTFGDFEWFDPGSEEHLKRVDERLNQNFLVGVSVERLENTKDYAEGSTLWDALIALVPRAIWPDKPVQAGSGDLVSRFTGIHFAQGTSVGIGQVMEFYVNFGTTGVIIGFLIMGVLVSGFDQAAAERLAANDLQGFVLWYLPGINLLQVGGSLVEVTASAAAGIVVALAANQYLKRAQRKRVISTPALTTLRVGPRA